MKIGQLIENIKTNEQFILIDFDEIHFKLLKNEKGKLIVLFKNKQDVLDNYKTIDNIKQSHFFEG